MIIATKPPVPPPHPTHTYGITTTGRGTHTHTHPPPMDGLDHHSPVQPSPPPHTHTLSLSLSHRCTDILLQTALLPHSSGTSWCSECWRWTESRFRMEGERVWSRKLQKTTQMEERNIWAFCLYFSSPLLIHRYSFFYWVTSVLPLVLGILFQHPFAHASQAICVCQADACNIRHADWL